MKFKKAEKHLKDVNMKKLFRRNQIIITTLAIMIAAALCGQAGAGGWSRRGNPSGGSSGDFRRGYSGRESGSRISVLWRNRGGAATE